MYKGSEIPHMGIDNLKSTQKKKTVLAMASFFLRLFYLNELVFIVLISYLRTKKGSIYENSKNVSNFI